MEAKDTVIQNKDIMDLVIPCETCDKKPALGFSTSECMECIALKHREKQAEISFKAGMQKVVDIYRKENPSDYKKHKVWWQAFLKENGLESNHE